jgi:LysR family transcriptional regulator, regulator for genes of the gallate degradation pathway
MGMAQAVAETPRNIIPLQPINRHNIHPFPAPEADRGRSGDLIHHLANLRVFLSAAHAGSMARAAEQLFKAPSAVTRSITDLERAIGTPLFLRQPRGIALTPCGEIVLRRAQRIQQEIQTAAAPFTGPRSSPHAIGTLLCNGRKLMLLAHLTVSRNISLAAERMAMTQAGASMALARMEDMLGHSLFHRRNDGMVPTEAAEQLVMHAHRVFAELRHLTSDLAALSGMARGSVILGTTPLGRTGHVTTAIAQAIAANPGLRITTIESSYSHLVDVLAKGEVDMVVGALRPTDQCHGLVTEPLFVDRLAILARADHPLARRRHLDLADLADERWVMPRMNALARPLIDATFAEAGLAPPVAAIETGDLAIVRQLLRTTDMLAITTPHQLAEDIALGQIRELDVAALGVTRMIGLICRRGAILNTACKQMIDAIRAVRPPYPPAEL